MALIQNKRPASLTLPDYLAAGFRGALTPTFSVPIILIGLLVNLALNAAFGQQLAAFFYRSSGTAATASIAEVFATSIFSVVANVFVGLYALIFALKATSGAMPEPAEVVAAVRKRWVSILGSGVLVAGATLGLVIGAVILMGIAIATFGGTSGAGISIVILGGVAYLLLRLSFASWLAAEKYAAMDSLKESWRRTRGSILTIFGWSLAGGLVFGVVNIVAALILTALPGEIATSLSGALAASFSYGAGAALYRKVVGGTSGSSSTTTSSAGAARKPDRRSIAVAAILALAVGSGVGYAIGDSQGYNRGFDAGYSSGYDKGQVDGYASGESAGQSEGWDAGWKAGSHAACVIWSSYSWLCP